MSFSTKFRCLNATNVKKFCQNVFFCYRNAQQVEQRRSLSIKSSIDVAKQESLNINDEESSDR